MEKKVFENIRILRKDMEIKGWWISSFQFSYKAQNFIVLIKRFGSNEKKIDKYALLKIEFLKQNNFDDNLEVEANSSTLIVKSNILRRYFNIEYSENLGDIFKQFYSYLATFIPKQVNDNPSDIERDAMIRSLSKSDSEDPNKIYCTEVRRNGHKSDGTLKKRSPFNDNKTRLRRPFLYEKLGGDANLSFCYSKDRNEERSDEIIIYNWARKNQQ